MHRRLLGGPLLSFRNFPGNRRVGFRGGASLLFALLLGPRRVISAALATTVTLLSESTVLSANSRVRDTILNHNIRTVPQSAVCAAHGSSSVLLLQVSAASSEIETQYKSPRPISWPSASSGTIHHRSPSRTLSTGESSILAITLEFSSRYASPVFFCTQHDQTFDLSLGLLRELASPHKHSTYVAIIS